MNQEQIDAILEDFDIKSKATHGKIMKLKIPAQEKRTLLMGLYQHRQAEPLWNDILNSKSRQVLENAGVNLTDTEHRIVNELSQHGIAITTLKELFPQSEGVLSDLQAFADMRRRAYERDAPESNFEKAAFVRFLFGGGGAEPEIRLDEPGIREFLSQPVLNIAGMHFGSAAKFVRFSLQSTVSQRPGTERKASQRWHRDPDDRRIFKMFIYLSDVDEYADGPFEYVRASHDRGFRSSLFPQTSPYGFYPPDGEVEKAVPFDDIVTVMGKAGTVIFADTNAIHRGGYSTRKERTMFAGVFVSEASSFGPRYVIADSARMSALSPLAHYAVT